MAVKAKLEIEHAGKSYEVTIRPKTWKEFEKKFDLTFSAYVQNESLTQRYWLAWHSSLLEEKTDLGFEEWLDDLDGVDLEEIGEEHPKGAKIVSSETSSD